MLTKVSQLLEKLRTLAQDVQHITVLNVLNEVHKRGNSGGFKCTESPEKNTGPSTPTKTGVATFANGPRVSENEDYQ